MSTKHATVQYVSADLQLREVSVSATLNQGGNVPLHPVMPLRVSNREIKKKVQNVIQQARLTELKPHHRWQVSVRFDQEPSPEDNGWELAAVIADRIARKQFSVDGKTILALGCSSEWDRGYIESMTDIDYSARINYLSSISDSFCVYLANSEGKFSKPALEKLNNSQHEINYLTHPGGLSGHPDPESLCRRAKVWFPLVGDDKNNDLAWVEVSAWPVAHESKAEPIIHCASSLDKKRQNDILDTLTSARLYDPINAHQWAVSIRFSRTNFIDNSFELALVMADRLARGRDVPPRQNGRLIATGQSKFWDRGQVETVGKVTNKIKLFSEFVRENDQILIPLELNRDDTHWLTSEEGQACIEKIRTDGARLTHIEHVPCWSSPD